MNLADVMDDIAEALRTIDDLNVFEWPPGTATPPAAIVGYPTTYTYDATYGRGMDTLNLPVVLILGRATAQSTRDQIAQYVNGSGAKSVKAVLESSPYSAFHTLRVMNVEFDTYELSGVPYAAAIFDIDIAGSGSA